MYGKVTYLGAAALGDRSMRALRSALTISAKSFELRRNERRSTRKALNFELSSTFICIYSTALSSHCASSRLQVGIAADCQSLAFRALLRLPSTGHCARPDFLHHDFATSSSATGRPSIDVFREATLRLFQLAHDQSHHLICSRHILCLPDEERAAGSVEPGHCRERSEGSPARCFS